MTTVVPLQPVPVGLISATRAAQLLKMPEVIVRSFAVTHPDLLPPFQLINGQPWFAPINIEGVAR